MRDFADMPQRLLAARAGLAALRLKGAALRLALALKHNFSPNQPRIPAGNPGGGSGLVRVAGGDEEEEKP